jgi:hypothetical protein
VVYNTINDNLVNTLKAILSWSLSTEVIMFVRFRIAKAGLMAGDVIKSIMVGRYRYSLNEYSFIKS